MIIQGEGRWCKIVGEPVPNKFKNGAREWSFELYVDEANQRKLLDAGMNPSYLKDKGDGVFLSFSRDELKKDGEPSKPFQVVDAAKNPWPADKKIGNGSTLNVIVNLNERTFRGEKFLKPSVIAVQIWKYVEYKKDDGFPTGESPFMISEGATAEETW